MYTNLRWGLPDRDSQNIQKLSTPLVRSIIHDMSKEENPCAFLDSAMEKYEEFRKVVSFLLKTADPDTAITQGE